MTEQERDKKVREILNQLHGTVNYQDEPTKRLINEILSQLNTIIDEEVKVARAHQEMETFSRLTKSQPDKGMVEDIVRILTKYRWQTRGEAAQAIASYIQSKKPLGEEIK